MKTKFPKYVYRAELVYNSPEPGETYPTIEFLVPAIGFAIAAKKAENHRTEFHPDYVVRSLEIFSHSELI